MLQELDIHGLTESEYDFSPDNLAHETEFHSEHSRFEYPPWIWGLMFAAYAVFFAAIAMATGHDGKTVFMIAISIAYTVMYFGTAAVLVNIKKQPEDKKSFPPQVIETWTGPLSVNSAAIQILTVPAMLALFGVSIAIICGAR